MSETKSKRPRKSIFQRADEIREQARDVNEQKRKFRNNYLFMFGTGIEYLYLHSEECRKIIKDLMLRLSEKDKDGNTLIIEEDIKKILRGIAYLDNKIDMGNRIYLEGVTEKDKRYLEEHGAIYDINLNSFFINRGQERDFLEWIPEDERVYLKIASNSGEAEGLIAQGVLVDTARKELYIFKSMVEDFKHLIPKNWTLPAWKQIELKTPEKGRTVQRFEAKAKDSEQKISLIDGKFFAEPGFDLLTVKSFLPEELLDLLARGRVYLETERKVSGKGIKYSQKREKFYIVKGNDISEVQEYFPELIKELIRERGESWDTIWGISEKSDIHPYDIESLWDDDDRIYLDVPYDSLASEHPEKDEVKSLGAKFDGQRTKWFIEKGKQDPTKFTKYLPKK